MNILSFDQQKTVMRVRKADFYIQSQTGKLIKVSR